MHNQHKLVHKVEDGSVQELNKKSYIRTSAPGSNIFFNSKHSLGFPTGSGTIDAISCAGRTGVGIAAGAPPKAILIDCWVGADPFSPGTPSDPATLQQK